MIELNIFVFQLTIPKRHPMKKLVLTLIIIMMASLSQAQPNKRTSAFNYHRYGELDKAKQAIDEAAQNEKTIADAKTWYYRGNIYLDIANSTNEKYKNLDSDPLGQAYDSYQKALKLDTKNEFKSEIILRMLALGEAYYNQGVINFNNKEYKNAALKFEKAFDVNQSVDRVDTSALYNAAIAASIGKENEMAKNYYKEVMALNYDKPDIYSSLTELYKISGDTAMALKTILEGRAKYPDDFNLLIAETNIYLAKSETSKALNNLEIALQKDTTNPTIYFAVGTNYDQLGQFEKAESSYKNAIKLKPDYFEANYNLGALYVNRAADVLEKANNLPLDAVKEYDIQKKKADDLLTKSLPYLEKSHQLEPNDINTMASLKEIYARLNMKEKSEEIDKELKSKK
jgi:tetratricopeptide (TPR) repeat protein